MRKHIGVVVVVVVTRSPNFGQAKLIDLDYQRFCSGYCCYKSEEELELMFAAVVIVVVAADEQQQQQEPVKIELAKHLMHLPSVPRFSRCHLRGQKPRSLVGSSAPQTMKVPTSSRAACACTS